MIEIQCSQRREHLCSNEPKVKAKIAIMLTRDMMFLVVEGNFQENAR